MFDYSSRFYCRDGGRRPCGFGVPWWHCIGTIGFELIPRQTANIGFRRLFHGAYNMLCENEFPRLCASFVEGSNFADYEQRS